MPYKDPERKREWRRARRLALRAEREAREAPEVARPVSPEADLPPRPPPWSVCHYDHGGVRLLWYDAERRTWRCLSCEPVRRPRGSPVVVALGGVLLRGIVS